MSWSTPAIPTTSCSIISRSARRRRARRTRCRTGWRSCTTTSRRPSTSSACTGRWRGSASADGASCGPTRTAAISRWAIRSSTGRSSKRSGFHAPASCRSSRTSRISTRRRTGCVAREFDDEWTNILFVGRVIAEQEDRGRHPLLSRVSDDFQPAIPAADRRGASGFERYVASLHQLVATLGASHVYFIGHVSDEELVGVSTRLPICSCAPASTRGSACRSSRRSTCRCRCSPSRQRRCPPRWTARESYYETRSAPRRPR